MIWSFWNKSVLVLPARVLHQRGNFDPIAWEALDDGCWVQVSCVYLLSAQAQASYFIFAPRHQLAILQQCIGMRYADVSYPCYEYDAVSRRLVGWQWLNVLSSFRAMMKFWPMIMSRIFPGTFCVRNGALITYTALRQKHMQHWFFMIFQFFMRFGH